MTSAAAAGVNAAAGDAAIRALVRDQRSHLYTSMEGFGDDDWEAASLCDGWTNRDVAAHLVIATEASPTRVMRLMWQAKGGFDAAMEEGVKQMRSLPVAEVVETLRRNETRVAAPPMLGVRSPLMDIYAHSYDVLAPLGRADEVEFDELAVCTALDFLTTFRMRKYFGFSISPDVRLECTDANWSCGPGSAAVVEVPAAALFLSFVGRDPALVDPAAAQLLNDAVLRPKR